jgi:hypothetical protein
MFKHSVYFEKEINGFKSVWHLDNGMPTTVAKEMLLYFLKCIGQIEDQAQANQAAQTSSEQLIKDSKITSIEENLPNAQT